MPPNASDPPVAAGVVDRLRETGDRIALAEGCTGGLVASLVTDVPGASDCLDRAWVPYGYDALRTELGVERETLDDHGVVSEAVARQLARRARDRADVGWGVSTVGVLGPGGGSDGKPVGTAYVGVAHAADWETGDSGATVRRFEFRDAGGRGEAKTRIARATLDLLDERVDVSRKA